VTPSLDPSPLGGASTGAMSSHCGGGGRLPSAGAFTRHQQLVQQQPQQLTSGGRGGAASGPLLGPGASLAATSADWAFLLSNAGSMLARSGNSGCSGDLMALQSPDGAVAPSTSAGSNVVDGGGVAGASPRPLAHGGGSGSSADDLGGGIAQRQPERELLTL